MKVTALGYQGVWVEKLCCGSFVRRMARLGVERDCVGRMAGLLRQAAAGALAAAMVSQAFRASAVYMSAGPPPM